MPLAFSHSARALAAIAFASAMTVAAPAVAYTAKVENACRADYFQNCPGYPLGSASLRLCMESKSKQISRGCADALVKAGLVDRRRIARGY